MLVRYRTRTSVHVLYTYTTVRIANAQEQVSFWREAEDRMCTLHMRASAGILEAGLRMTCIIAATRRRSPITRDRYAPCIHARVYIWALIVRTRGALSMPNFLKVIDTSLGRCSQS